MGNDLNVIFFYHVLYCFLVYRQSSVEDLCHVQCVKTSGVAIFWVKIISVFFKCVLRKYS